MLVCIIVGMKRQGFLFSLECRFEQNDLVTGIFFRTAIIGNQFLAGEQSLVTCICSIYSHVMELQETWSLEKNYQFYHQDTMFLRCD